MHARKETIDDLVSPTYVGVRQQHHRFKASTRITSNIIDGEEAGMAIVQSNEYYLTASVVKEDNKTYLKALMKNKEQSFELGKNEIMTEPLEIILTGQDQVLSIHYKQDGRESVLAHNIDMNSLSTEVAGGFVGCTIGMYITSKGSDSNSYADFNWLSYIGF